MPQYTEEEEALLEIKERKYNYWRGFFVASCIWFVAFSIFCNYLIKITM